MITKEPEPITLYTPRAIYNDKSLSGNAKWILTEIMNLMKVGSKYCWASNGHFAKMFNLDKANVSYHIKQIEKSGWIKTQPVKKCNLKNCQLKDRGWHRHIYPLTPLSNILESLSSKRQEPIKSTGMISNTIKNTINKKGVVDKNVDGLLIKVTSWAYKRSPTSPNCSQDSFKRAVKKAVDKHGETFVQKAFMHESNAIQFLKNIK